MIFYRYKIKRPECPARRDNWLQAKDTAKQGVQTAEMTLGQLLRSDKEVLCTDEK